MTTLSNVPYLLGYIISFDISEPYKLDANPKSVGAFMFEHGIIHDVKICLPNGRQLLRTRGYLISSTIDWEFCKNVMMEIAEIIKRKKLIEEGAHKYERYTNI